MAKKKILIRIGSLRHGGAEKVLTTFLKNIPPDKYEIDLLLNLKFGKYLKDIPDWITIYYLNKGEMITTNRPLEIPVKIYRKVYQKILKIFPKLLYTFILKNKKYDIELIANHSLLNEMLKSPLHSSKKVVWIHSDIFNNDEVLESDLQNYFEADKILVISDKIKEEFNKISRNESDKNKIVKIFNPIDSNEIINLSLENIDTEHLFSNCKLKTFVSVGTVYPAKGFDRLINVHKKLIDEGFYHNILIVGDGYDLGKIASLIKNLDVENTVKLIGFKENPYPLIKNADYYILSSRYEGYPTVLFEALTLGKPLIATDVSGAAEILENGKLGMVVENSEEGIYNGIKKFLESPEVPLAYSKEMNDKKLPFSLKNAVNSLTNIFDNL
ncbi:glycosyltransferase [Apibacter sp. HY039]|uniref:glycosyltransferase n=1 Tax=Apibacter sp. HY039 TaxID=2501476 RepID=UPI000FEB975F|nr:glycosyltransferase [Apibacter sp. HY039]